MNLMRAFAWLLVLGLFLFAGLCFAVSYQLGVELGSPQATQLRGLAIGLSRFAPDQAADALAYLRGKRDAADLGVILGFASAGLGILCTVILAATLRRHRENEDELTEDDERMGRIRRL